MTARRRFVISRHEHDLVVEVNVEHDGEGRRVRGVGVYYADGRVDVGHVVDGEQGEHLLLTTCRVVHFGEISSVSVVFLRLFCRKINESDDKLYTIGTITAQ